MNDPQIKRDKRAAVLEEGGLKPSPQMPLNPLQLFLLFLAIHLFGSLHEHKRRLVLGTNIRTFLNLRKRRSRRSFFN